MVDQLQRQRVLLGQESDVYNAAMLVFCLSQQAGAPPLVATEAATMASELGMNIVRYAGRGSLTLSIQGGEAGFIDILADDNGPGISDLQLAMTDHYSSRGTLGLGLPGVRRMSDSFDIRSSPGVGTTVQARRHFHAARAMAEASAQRGRTVRMEALPAPAVSGWQHATARRPCFGEVVSGDGAMLKTVAPGCVVAAIIDVLGHGQRAHELARLCERWLLQHAHADLVELMLELHRELRGSLGAAVTLAYLDAPAGRMHVVGVGNTRLYAAGNAALDLTGQPGIVGGAQLPRLRPTVGHVAPGDLLVLVTDGIREDLGARDIAVWRHLPVDRITQQLLRVHGRVHDDATCMVLRCPR